MCRGGRGGGALRFRGFICSMGEVYAIAANNCGLSRVFYTSVPYGGGSQRKYLANFVNGRVTIIVDFCGAFSAFNSQFGTCHGGGAIDFRGFLVVGHGQFGLFIAIGFRGVNIMGGFSVTQFFGLLRGRSINFWYITPIGGGGPFTCVEGVNHLNGNNISSTSCHRYFIFRGVTIARNAVTCSSTLGLVFAIGSRFFINYTRTRGGEFYLGLAIKAFGSGAIVVFSCTSGKLSSGVHAR